MELIKKINFCNIIRLNRNFFFLIFSTLLWSPANAQYFFQKSNLKCKDIFLINSFENLTENKIENQAQLNSSENDLLNKSSHLKKVNSKSENGFFNNLNQFYQEYKPKSEVSDHIKDLKNTVESGSKLLFNNLSAKASQVGQLITSISKELQEQIDDPYSMEAHLGQSNDGDQNWKALSANELTQFAKIVEENPLRTHKTIKIANTISLDQYVQILNEWVKSPAHAAFLYNNINKFESSSTEVMRFLIAENIYFQKADKVVREESQIVTYSFEHETFNKTILDWYKLPEQSDEEWFQLSLEQRAELLSQDSFHQKRFLPASLVAPTQLKPHFLGGFSIELSGNLRDAIENGVFTKAAKPVYEVAHRSFEITRDELMSQIKNMNWLLGDAKGFHVNVVFDLPENYPHFESFMMWLKQAEDFVYLTGLETGFYGTDKIRLPNIPKPFNLSSLKSNMLNGSYALPKTMVEVLPKSHKYFHIGIRTGSRYGTPAKGYKRFSLELRDVANSLPELEFILNKIGTGVAQRIWEQKPYSNWQDAGIVWLQSKPVDTEVKLGSWVVPHNLSTLLLTAEPHALIPLELFEYSQIYDYRNSKINSLSRDDERIFIWARNNYVAELTHYLHDVESKLNTANLPSQKEISDKVKFFMSKWAQQVQLSKMYSVY